MAGENEGDKKEKKRKVKKIENNKGWKRCPSDLDLNCSGWLSIGLLESGVKSTFNVLMMKATSLLMSLLCRLCASACFIAARQSRRFCTRGIVCERALNYRTNSCGILRTCGVAVAQWPRHD